MSAQGSVKAPEMSGTELRARKEGRSKEASLGSSSWKVWKEVLIAELLNVLERRRYDATELR
jgi:hypothetical protein